MDKSMSYRKVVWFVALSITLCNIGAPIAGARLGGFHGYTHVNVNRPADFNRNVNVHRDVNVDVDYHDHYHPIATAAGVAAAATVTSAAIGSVLYRRPVGAVPVVVGGVSYLQVGSTWYQPQYAGTQVTYVVVQPPR
jgi:hypothetical protein